MSHAAISKLVIDRPNVVGRLFRVVSDVQLVFWRTCNGGHACFVLRLLVGVAGRTGTLRAAASFVEAVGCHWSSDFFVLNTKASCSPSMNYLIWINSPTQSRSQRDDFDPVHRRWFPTLVAGTTWLVALVPCCMGSKMGISSAPP